MLEKLKGLFGQKKAPESTTVYIKPVDIIKPKVETPKVISNNPKPQTELKSLTKKNFSLSTSSLNTMKGVKPELVNVVKRAIELSSIDFKVIEGVRTLAKQKMYVAQGKSQTLNSKHITGDAVDLVAIVNGKPSWELNLYDNIADAMKKAATELGVSIRWGAAWNTNDIRKWNGTMESAMMNYVDSRRKVGKRPFIDGPHFELS